MFDLRDYIAPVKCLHALVADRGVSWSQVARRCGKSEAWIRKVRHARLSPSAETVDALAQALDVGEDDLTYWRALWDTRSPLRRTRALALATLWTHGRTDRVHPAPEAERWLQTQPLTVWAVLALSACDDWTAAPEAVGARLRPPISASEAASALRELESRQLLPSPWLERPPTAPDRIPTHREAIQRVRHALSARWGRSDRFSIGVTFSLPHEALQQMHRDLEHLVTNVTGLAYADAPQQVMMLNIASVRCSGPVDMDYRTRRSPPRAPRHDATPATLWDNPTAVSWQDAVRARLAELDLTQRDLARALQLHFTLVSRLLSHRHDVHQLREPRRAVSTITRFLQLDDMQTAELRALIDVTHPDADIRGPAYQFLLIRRRAGLALTSGTEPRVAPLAEWYDTVVSELELADALPTDPQVLGELIVPPITAEEASNALARTGRLDAQALHVTTPGGPEALHRHIGWCDAIDRILASDQHDDVRMWTVAAPASAAGFAEARELVMQWLMRFTQHAEQPARGTAAVRHLRCSLLSMSERPAPSG